MGLIFPRRYRVYVSSESESALDVIDTQSGEILRKIPLSGPSQQYLRHQDGRRVVVGIRTLPGALDLIDTATLTLAKTIPVTPASTMLCHSRRQVRRQRLHRIAIHHCSGSSVRRNRVAA